MCFRQSLEVLRCFGQSPIDLLETADAAQGGRDTRVLGDPMDLIRCQSYLAKHSEHTVRDGETIMKRERKEAHSTVTCSLQADGLVFPLSSLVSSSLVFSYLVSPHCYDVACKHAP